MVSFPNFMLWVRMTEHEMHCLAHSRHETTCWFSLSGWEELARLKAGAKGGVEK